MILSEIRQLKFEGRRFKETLAYFMASNVSRRQLKWVGLDFRSSRLFKQWHSALCPRGKMKIRDRADTRHRATSTVSRAPATLANSA